jgi:hypothetical protein
VVVDGQIGNLKGLRFILDTGATHSLIDRKVADRLRVEAARGKVMNFDKSSRRVVEHPGPPSWTHAVQTVRVMVVNWPNIPAGGKPGRNIDSIC